MTQRIFVNQLNNNILTSLNSFTQAPQIGKVCSYALDYIKNLERVIEDNFAPSALAKIKLQTAKNSAHLFGIDEIVDTENPIDAFGIIKPKDQPEEDLKDESLNEESTCKD